MSKIDVRDLVKSPIRVLAIGFGSGLVPHAPGTAGTLLGVPLVIGASVLPVWGYVALTALLFLLGVWFCEQTTRHLGVEDHPAIVWDEITGYMIAMTAVPVTWWSVVAGFVAFRFFDIVKPWPVRQLDEKLTGGLGVMLDDAAAGIYTAMSMHLLIALF